MIRVSVYQIDFFPFAFSFTVDASIMTTPVQRYTEGVSV